MTVLSARRSPAPGRRREVTTSSLNWLRAGVLGANDGIVSIAATVLGVAGASTPVRTIAVAGIAALVAGALSMAAGEYVSVSSQRDAERAAVRRGRVLPTLVVRGGEEFTNPWHAAVASLGAFVAGGLIPLVVVLAPWGAARVPATFAAVVVALALTGLVAARFSGAEPRRAVLRNIVGGSVAMAVTFAVGAFVGVAL
ncbi:VIT1/CCC1 transporter family protein [Cellulomonas fengjieae]|uniref:VIT1/CCC1 transporter family protein n=1 Tax=Cellulomonas fengjieae TaxID=2819978 RepID=UPI001AAFBF50|nr:VIT1/CCC1 transporter family protein [Cellulomonas fengjieae]MBO3101214.1 VIT1/CCC1 transporter family protein [Cellulomonas fengjieae]